MTDLELTRRDALAALAAAGVAVGGAYVLDEDPPDGPVGDHERRTVVAVARVVYPSSVDGIEEFVTDFLRGRTGDDSAHAAGIAAAVAYLDDYAEAYHDTRFIDLDPATRETTMRKMGVDTAESVPEGGGVQRVRYYLVNEVLFALYTSPTGGELVGLENPQGYPGGTTSYRRGPGE